MALAALLRFGKRLPLRLLNVSYNDLVGVAAQCFLRQMHARLEAPPAPPPLPGVTGQPSTSSDGSDEQGCGGDGDHGEGGGGGSGPGGTGRLGGTIIEFRTKGCRVSETVSPSAHAEDGGGGHGGGGGGGLRDGNDESRAPVDGGAAGSKPPSFAQAAAARGAEGEGCPPQPPRLPPHLLPHEVPISGEVGRQQAKAMTSFSLDLSLPLPDRCIARLLVEHEVAARQLRRAAWHGMVLDECVYRVGGCELVPFDVVRYALCLSLSQVHEMMHPLSSPSLLSCADPTPSAPQPP